MIVTDGKWLANALDFLKSNPKKLCVDAIRMNNIILPINIKSWSEKNENSGNLPFFFSLLAFRAFIPQSSNSQFIFKIRLLRHFYQQKNVAGGIFIAKITFLPPDS